ncbi:MAG: hypothetical protein JSU66_03520 [Deltaproteobacteria bacterium]|nr:MAG: hypothetical protein JSU66_03520 [Deltaproteobacteria bacterium]
MRWNSFARSVGFAAVAAALAIPFVLLLGPWLGRDGAAAAYAIAISSVYLAGIAAGRRRAIAAAALAGLLGAVLYAVAASFVELAIGAALVLATLRSGLLYRARRPARALALEACLGAGGLLLARFLADASLAGFALAVWGFFLVQSVFFLLGSRALPDGTPTERDPFERAQGRLLELLEDGLL